MEITSVPDRHDLAGRYPIRGDRPALRSALAIVALEIIQPGFNANQEVGWRPLGVQVPRAPKHE